MLPASDEPPPELPGIAVGERVGAGGYATTWSVQLGPTSAILKLAHRAGAGPAARFAHEYEVLQRLGSTGAPEPLGFGQLGTGRPYILMSRTRGAPLSAELAAAERPWTVESALALVESLCEQLAAVHGRGIVHGDLKPENLLVAEGTRPEVGIVDFGVARGATLPSSPPPGVGTIEYMAPEQLGGRLGREAGGATGTPSTPVSAGTPGSFGSSGALSSPSIDARTDVYAVAAILFELLVGHPPFVGDRATIAFQLRNARAPRLRSLVAAPLALDDLVARCLEKRPDDRPADAGALLAELRAVGGAHPATAPVPADLAREVAATRATCALLAVETRAIEAIATLTEVVQGRGGALARRKGNRLVFAFEPGRHLLPLRAAAAAASAVASPTRGATVHAAALTTRRRADGTTAFFGDELERVASWIRPTPGVSFTEAAAAALAPFALDRPRPLIGRATELAALLDAGARALAGDGPGIVLLTAAPGLGKTMLLDTLAAALVRAPGGWRVFSITAAQPLVAGPPNAAREILERLPPADRLDELARAAATWILDPRSDRAIEPLRVAPGALRAATTRAVANGLARAALRPIAILIDDAHLADVAVLDAFAAVARVVTGAPLLVVLAGRPELARDHAELVARAPLARSIELSPLAPLPAAELARSLLAPVELIPEAVTERLFARTQGHPLELVELAAALRRSGAIGQSERGRWELDLGILERVLERVPDSHLYQWLAEQAFADVPPSLFAHAELVALLGDDVSLREVREVVAELDRAGSGDRFPLDPARGLELLCDAGVLVRTGDAFRFRHSLLAGVRETVAAPHARAVHTAALAAWTRREDAPADQRLAKQAHHAYRAGRHDLAAPLHLELGTLALTRHRYADAELALSRALDGDPAASSVERGFVHWQRGIARYRLGRHDAAEADFEIARNDAHARGDRAREAAILLDEAMSLDWAVEYRAAARCVESAAALLDDSAGPHLHAYLAMSIARSHIRENREVDAIEPLERAIALSAPLGPDAYEIHVVALLQSAPILATVGRHAEARKQFDRVLALTEAAGDRLHHCAALANRLWRPFATPDLGALRRDHASVLAIARELGHFIIEFTAEVNFAGALHHLGYPELALAPARRAVELERTRLGDAARPEAALLLVRILAAGGRLEEVAAVVDVIEAHQQTARAMQRAEALLTPADQALLDGVRIAVGLPVVRTSAAVLAEASALLPSHELGELRGLVGSDPSRSP